MIFAATEEDLKLAQIRQETFEQLFEALDLLGYLNKLQRLLLCLFRKSDIQALLIAWLLVLEQSKYGPNIEMINEALRTNLPAIRRSQLMRQLLQQELPEVAKELLPFYQISRVVPESNLKQEVYMEHMREVYRQHKEALDAFWKRHPELSDEIPPQQSSQSPA